ncbi:hypothetical protein OCU04_010989 [Sclerotinia nivalis]|uniref:RING-type domain-containing protein n=1 Tax=Sclerotinia nivalis TaxID=352851 RepID=A0A9X0AE46_9HELO|nr:hypothetical protein OCU04_010989 [Sclerotinia nivalis]
MLDDPRIAEGFNPTARQEFEDRWRFELAHFEELNALEDIDGIFARADAFKRKSIKEEERESPFVFCSSGILSRDVIQHLERLLYGRLLTYFWSNVLNGRGQEISRERRMIIIQLQQALLYSRLFTDIQHQAMANGDMGKLRQSINAGAPWITTVVTDPALLDEDCTICKMERLSSRKTVRLPCNHMYHEDCLKRCVEIATCPYCRSKEARGEEPKISAPAAGPIPEWLFAIHPFHRRDIRRPSLTYEEIEALTGIYNDASDKAWKLSEPLEPHYRKLSGIRQRIDILERKIEGSFFDIVQKKLDKLPDAQVEMIRQAQRLNDGMKLKVNYWGLQHFKAIGRTNQFDKTDFVHRLNLYQEWIYAKYLDSDEKKKQASGKALDEVYAPLKFLSSDDLLELSSLRLDEEDAVKTLYTAVDQWRVAIYARQAAEENWSIYLGDNEDVA